MLATASGTDTDSYAGAGQTVARIANSVTGNLDSLVSPAGERIGVKAGSVVNWFLPDLHGDLAGSLSADEATVVNAIRYDAWGDTLATGSAGGTKVGDTAWKYQGRLDVSPAGLSTPLYATGARLYAPGIGAFTSLDTVSGKAQSPLSLNRFLYAEANPATLVDPTGHAACQGSEDLCDETMAIKYRATSAGTEARHRLTRRQATADYWAAYWAHRAAAKRFGVVHDIEATPLAKAQTAQAAANDAQETRSQGANTARGSGMPSGTLRDQLTGQCNASGPQNAGYCSSYATAPGLDGPAQDVTPADLSPWGIGGRSSQGSQGTYGVDQHYNRYRRAHAGRDRCCRGAGAPELWGVPVDAAAGTLGFISLATGAVATAGDCSTGLDVQCGLDAMGDVTGLGGPVARVLSGAGVLSRDAGTALDLGSQWVGQAFAWAGSIIGQVGQ